MIRAFPNYFVNAFKSAEETKSTKGKMERRRSMKTDKARNILYPYAAAVPLILERVYWRQEQNQAPKHFVWMYLK